MVRRLRQKKRKETLKETQAAQGKEKEKDSEVYCGKNETRKRGKRKRGRRKQENRLTEDVNETY